MRVLYHNQTARMVTKTDQKLLDAVGEFLPLGRTYPRYLRIIIVNHIEYDIFYCVMGVRHNHMAFPRGRRIVLRLELRAAGFCPLRGLNAAL